MPRQPSIAGGPQRDPDFLDDPGSHRLRVCMRSTVGQVEDAGAHESHGPVGGDIAEPDRQRRDGGVDLEVHDDFGDAEDLERLGEGLGGVGRARILVPAQVACQAVGCPAGAPRQAPRVPVVGRWRNSSVPTSVPAMWGGAAGAAPGVPVRARRWGPRRPDSPPRTAMPARPSRDAGTPTPPAIDPGAPPGTARAARTRARTRRSAAPGPSRCRCRAGVDRRTGRSRAVRRGSGPARRHAARSAPSSRPACATAPGSGPASGTPGRRNCRASRRC